MRTEVEGRVLGMPAALLTLLLFACNTWTPENGEELTGGARERSTRANGTIPFVLELPEDATELLFTAQVEYPYGVYIISMTDPDGVRVFDAEATWSAPYSLTGAIAPQWAVSLNYPMLDTDTPLQAGKYRVIVGVVEPGQENEFRRGVPVRAAFHTKADPEPGGILHVNLVFAAGTELNAGWEQAVDAAVDVWRALYAQAGIELAVEMSVAQMGELRAPGRGDADTYVMLSEQVSMRSVTVILMPEIVDEPGLFGIAGGIPGPLVASPQSAVAVSLLVNAGSDAVYSPAEERLLGETLAHEVGHFLGLFHPVEATWESWDALQDTADCTTESECDSALGGNLMYPYPLCGGQGGVCSPQSELTAQQEALANRYVGVR